MDRGKVVVMHLSCLSLSILVFCCWLLNSSVISAHLSARWPPCFSHFLLRSVICVFVFFLCIFFFFIDFCIYLFIYLSCPPESPAVSVGTEWLPAESPRAAGDQSSLYFPSAQGAGRHSRRPWHVLVLLATPPPTVVRALAAAQALPRSYKRLSVSMCFGIICCSPGLPLSHMTFNSASSTWRLH